MTAHKASSLAGFIFKSWRPSLAMRAISQNMWSQWNVKIAVVCHRHDLAVTLALGRSESARDPS